MKLTKEEARELITDIHNYKVANRCACPDPDNSEYRHSWNCMYEALEANGWIEKSAVDKAIDTARDFFDTNCNHPNITSPSVFISMSPYLIYYSKMNRLKILYEEAIKELQEKHENNKH